MLGIEILKTSLMGKEVCVYIYDHGGFETTYSFVPYESYGTAIIYIGEKYLKILNVFYKKSKYWLTVNDGEEIDIEFNLCHTNIKIKNDVNQII